jgi:hypothetical protein
MSLLLQTIYRKICWLAKVTHRVVENSVVICIWIAGVSNTISVRIFLARVRNIDAVVL